MDNYQIANRAQIGVLIPSTNTGVEYDLQKFGLDGVTWHPSRFWIELRNWADEVEDTGDDSNTVFERFLEIMRGEIPISLRNVISAKVNHIMLGMSAETFWGGVEGSIKFEEGIREHIGDNGCGNAARWFFSIKRGYSDRSGHCVLRCYFATSRAFLAICQRP